VDEFTEQEPVRECLVGNHCVHEREYCAVAAPKPFPRTLALMMLKNGPTSPVIGSIPGQPVGSSSNQVFAFAGGRSRNRGVLPAQKEAVSRVRQTTKCDIEAVHSSGRSLSLALPENVS
jgi:hypothetical protein